MVTRLVATMDASIMAMKRPRPTLGSHVSQARQVWAGPGQHSTAVLEENDNSPSTEKDEAPSRDIRLPIQQVRIQRVAAGLFTEVYLAWARAVGKLLLGARHANSQKT